jgi:hypothetical protein
MRDRKANMWHLVFTPAKITHYRIFGDKQTGTARRSGRVEARRSHATPRWLQPCALGPRTPPLRRAGRKPCDWPRESGARLGLD